MQMLKDELLVAYLDGELDDSRRAEVEASLKHDAAARDRMTQLSESAALLRAAFDEVLREEVPERLVAAARGLGASAGGAQQAEILPFQSRRPVRGWAAYRRWWVAVPVAASIFGVAIGGGLGYFGFDRAVAPAGEEHQVAANAAATNAWLDNVAVYHKLFVASAAAASSFADIPAKDGDGEVIRKISQRTSQQGLRVPDLKPWGLLFQGARVVVIESRPAAELLYTADNKAVGKAIGPLTVVIVPTKRPDVAPSFDRRQDVNLLHWRHKGHAYAIVGQADIGYMWGLANDIAWQLGAI
jgi:anti-sigma factor RsiW